ncbi:MAG: DUF4412 domain-containing protein [Flavobacteriales bacterium]|nr:DUF4412 domain-containing protein [Flavobacteriales bacterium]
MRPFLTFTSILLLTLVSATAQNFEGSIYFTKSNMMDVTRYAYHVKGNMVRIDEMQEGKEDLVAALLVNLETQETIALSHERKLYMKRPKGTPVETPKGLELKKGELQKSINGRNCSQYRVKSRELDRELTFWVTDGNFDFFPKLLNVLKRKDHYSTFYLSIPDLNGKFPLTADELTLLRDKKGFLQVDKIESKKLDDRMFAIPAGFEKVEK